MANKLNVKINAEFRPENRKAISTGDIEFTTTPNAKNYITGIQSIGTDEESLQIGDVSDAGFVVIVNKDNSNYVQIGLTGSYSIKLLPGQACAFPPAGTIYAKANDTACDVEFYVFPAEA